MTFERDFLNLAASTVQHVALSTHNQYGAPVYSTSASTYTAHVEAGARVVVTPEGREEVATATIYIMSSSASIGAQDKLTLPNSRQPRLLRVDVLNDDDGQHHVEVAIS